MHSPSRDSLWPEEVELQTDLSPSEWILPRLLPSLVSGGRGTPVTGVVPAGYHAYVRVLHPANAGHYTSAVSWRHVVDLSGRTYHPLMQFERINLAETTKTGRPPFGPPELGYLAPELCKVLFGLLAIFTLTPETCWLGIWEGWGSLGYPRSMSLLRFRHQPESRDEEFSSLEQQLTEVAERVNRAPRFAHPGRSYLLAKSPISGVCELGRPPLRITPSLVWPDDRAWCVGTEIDFDSTLVACGRACATALLSEEGLEALRVPPHGRLDFEGDELNPPSQGAP